MISWRSISAPAAIIEIEVKEGALSSLVLPWTVQPGFSPPRRASHFSVIFRRQFRSSIVHLIQNPEETRKISNINGLEPLTLTIIGAAS